MYQLLKKISLMILLTAVTTVFQNSWSLTKDRLEPYQFSTDKFLYFKDKHMILYISNAKIQQGTTLLTGDKIAVYLTPDSKLLKLIAYGKPAHYSTLPDNKPSKLFAEADVILYDAKNNVVRLIKHAKVTEGNELFTSDNILYDITHATVHSTAINNNRTVIIIPPQTNQG